MYICINKEQKGQQKSIALLKKEKQLLINGTMTAGDILRALYSVYKKLW